MTSLKVELEDLQITIAEETLSRVRKFWREHDFTLGVELLDAQHMWLIALAFHLEALMKDWNKRDNRQIEGVFREALRYADTHFAAEEMAFVEFRFPDADNHTAQHHTFREKIRNLLQSPEGQSVENIDRLNRFLQNWLIQHIKKEDMAYRDFFRQSSIDANSYFQRLVAGGSEYALSQNQLNLYAAISQHNEIIPGISNEVLHEIQRLWRSFSIRLYVPLIDMQHLWLIKMVVELSEALRLDYEKRANLLNDILPDVKQYIQEHFGAEEAMMDALDYPARAGHKNQHTVFVRTVTSHDADYATRTRQGASVLVNDLKDWLLSHIVIEDAKFAKLCREKNAEALAISKKLIQEKKVQFKKAQILLYQYIVEQSKRSP